MTNSEIPVPVARSIAVASGTPLPLGAWPSGGGVNFSVFSRHATAVELLLFESADAPLHQRSIQLDPAQHRTGDIWHVCLQGIGTGQVYAWRADGPYQPDKGMRFNRHRLLLDPHAVALVGTDRWDFVKARGDHPDSPDAACSLWCEDNEPWMARCMVTDSPFDWRGDRPLRHQWADTIIYESHVRGLTIHPSSAVAHPGTFLGVVEKIPYLQALGITSLELMPVQEFNEREVDRCDPTTGESLGNYWGYSTVAFFAPKESYSSRRHWGCQVDEFKTMVRELHSAGIEVILDIVFNHSAEGNELGPTLNFRGLDNPIYYLLESDPSHYRNFTGCGNTLNCNHPVVRDYILDCLRYWTLDMHVDGFRFDLASVLERDEEGNLLSAAPLLERIAEDPILRDIKLIAEAWDAAGIYQVGHFAGRRWSEWNGRFRDDVRRFWRGDPGLSAALASRLCGSADLYLRSGKAPLNSINFVTCHDGFTLADLVSYATKHNDANGEGNRDGAAENYSENHGAEGVSDDPGINAARLRKSKNFIATLMLSRGVPMLLGGDEFGRSQYGNNNAWCQDNPISWYDWNLLQSQDELYRFTCAMIAIRKRYGVLRREEFYTREQIGWFGADGRYPDWDRLDGILGCCIHTDDARGKLCMLFNARHAPVSFSLPGGPWRIAVNTAVKYEVPERESAVLTEPDCEVEAQSMMLLVA
ncbi:MAG: glycogen debranching protein GlgX [Halioglobus sp.]